MSGLAERFGWRNAWTSYESFVTLEYLSMPLHRRLRSPLYRTFSIDGVVSTICPLLAWVLRCPLALMALTTSALTFGKYLLAYQIFLLVGILLILVHLTIEAVRRTPFALAILAAFFFLAVGASTISFTPSSVSIPPLSPLIPLLPSYWFKLA